MSILLLVLLVVAILICLHQKIVTLTLSAILAKREIEPTEEEIANAREFVVGRLTGNNTKFK
jgi:hypothetical protein